MLDKWEPEWSEPDGTGSKGAYAALFLIFVVVLGFLLLWVP